MDPLQDSFAAAVVAGDRSDLTHAALLIARIAYPELTPEPHIARLDELAEEVRPRVHAATAPEAKLHTLVAFLFEEQGFRGNTHAYYDPRNSFLNDVLARRMGIPISLSVLMMDLAARLGLRLEGVGFPGHFLVRAPGEHGPLILDPFEGGRILDHHALLDRVRQVLQAGGSNAGAHPQRLLAQSLQTIGTSGILARMLANLLHVYLERNDDAHALSTVQLLLILQPDVAEHLRIRGMLYERLECHVSACDDFARYLTLAPAAAEASRVRDRLTRLRREHVTVH